MENISTQIGNRVRQLRRQRDMTQETLAFDSGLNVSFVSDIENSKKKPTVDSLEKLLIALDVTFQEFFAYENSIKNVDRRATLDMLVKELERCSDREFEKIYGIVKQVLDFKAT